VAHYKILGRCVAAAQASCASACGTRDMKEGRNFR
jgi:hypothetical protein